MYGGPPDDPAHKRSCDQSIGDLRVGSFRPEILVRRTDTDLALVADGSRVEEFTRTRIDFERLDALLRRLRRRIGNLGGRLLGGLFLGCRFALGGLLLLFGVGVTLGSGVPVGIGAATVATAA